MHTASSFPRNKFKLALVSACALGAALLGNAAHAANATATSSSTVVAPIAITKGADLAFGKFAAVTGGTVTVSTSGARTFGGAVLSVNGVAPTAARFDVTGDTGATYGIVFTGTTVLTSGSDTMAFTAISDFTAANTTSGTVSAGTLAGGAQSIYVGGTLTVASAQPAGTYSGTVIATVEYN